MCEQIIHASTLRKRMGTHLVVEHSAPSEPRAT
jgi:hypothetical protein